jgi:hypothetical protein
VITATATDLDGNTSEFSEMIGGAKDQVLGAANMPFRYSLNNSGLATENFEDLEVAIDNAFQAWDEIPTASIEMENAGTTDLRYASATDSVNLVTFQDDRFPFAPGVLAVTAKTLEMKSDGQTAEILDADIIFNPNAGNTGQIFRILEDGDTETEAFDIQSVATHEIGHALGMIHTGVYHSTMFFMIGFGTSERELEPDDIAWASKRYPNSTFYSEYGFISGKVTYGDIGNPLHPDTHPAVAGADPDVDEIHHPAVQNPVDQVTNGPTDNQPQRCCRDLFFCG